MKKLLFLSVLLSSYSYVYSSRQSESERSLVSAASTRQWDFVKHLLREEDRADLNINARDDKARTALHYAAGSGSEPVVAMLLEHGAQVDAMDCFRETPLQDAIKSGSEPVVAMLLEHGAQTDMMNCSGKTPLQNAMQSMSRSIVASLLDHSVDINARSFRGKTALHFAAESGFDSAVADLLARGAQADEVDSFGETVLHSAVKSGSRSIVASLLDQSVNVDVEDRGGKTALFYAKNEGVAELLVKRGGAKINVKTSSGYTPLMQAASCGNTSFLQFLIKEKVDVNATDVLGNTALHYARSGSTSQTSLLQAGANPRIKNNSGNSVYDDRNMRYTTMAVMPAYMFIASCLTKTP